MSVKRVLSYHLARLKDKRPEVRIASIKELELLGDPAALDALKLIYADPNEDPEVRKAAQAAGRTLFLKENSAQ